MSAAELVVNQQATPSEGQEKQEKNDVGGVGADLQDDVDLAGGESEHQNHDDEIERFVHGRFLSCAWRAWFSLNRPAGSLRQSSRKRHDCLACGSEAQERTDRGSLRKVAK